MHNLMLEAYPDSSPDVPRDILQTYRVKAFQPIPYPCLILQDVLKRWPFFRNFRVLMADFRVVNIRVNSSFKDRAVEGRLSWGILGCLGQLYVKKSRNVTKVEDAGIPKLDGFV